MIKLTQIEKNFFIDLFNRNGYVLDFSTPKFDIFTKQSIGVPLCETYGVSKGKSLEAYINEDYTGKSIILLKDLLDYYEINYDDEIRKNVRYSKLYNKCRDIIKRVSINHNDIACTTETMNKPKKTMIEMFISYCQKDNIYADDIDSHFKDKEVVIHRDIRDISKWGSIKEYMNTISNMDYTVLVITDNYLKSFNCMYEVLEVMKDHNYKNRIFPVVIETSIYKPSGRIEYVRYWEEEYKTLNKNLSEIELVNVGPLSDDLKRAQNIKSSMSEFLGLVSDMNNPNISDVNIAIENKLKEQGLLESKELPSNKSDIFSSLNIPKINTNTEPTDLEKNKFMSNSFESVNNLLSELCNQTQNENSYIQIQIERVDSRTFIYQFYKSGSQVRSLKIFLGNSFGGRENSIGVSCDNFSMGTNNSYNAMYSPKFENGQLYLYSIISIAYGKRLMSVEDVVKEIWTSYVLPHLR